MYLVIFAQTTIKQQQRQLKLSISFGIIREITIQKKYEVFLRTLLCIYLSTFDNPSK